MKKTMMILISLMLSVIALAQPNFLISRLSEAEIDRRYLKYPDGSITTAETYIQDFINKFRIDAYHFTVDAIEKGKTSIVMDSIKGLGQQDDFLDGIHILKFVDSIKTCFVENGKLYFLTYKPVKNNNASNITKSIYLYRRDDDSMRIASDLIRYDYRIANEYMRELQINSDKSESIYKISDTTNILLKKTPAIVYVTTTDKWKNDVFTYTNTIILLIPDGNYGYRSACFESNTRFAVNKIESISSVNGELTLKYESGTIIFKVVGDDVKVGGTIKLTRY